MMYRKLRNRAGLAAEDIARIKEQRQRSSEPKNGGMTLNEFFEVVGTVGKDEPIKGTLRRQIMKRRAAA